jgi:hypothetical protein
MLLLRVRNTDQASVKKTGPVSCYISSGFKYTPESVDDPQDLRTVLPDPFGPANIRILGTDALTKLQI